MPPIILDLSKHGLDSNLVRVQDYAIWSGSPKSPIGVVRYRHSGQKQLSANRANLDKRVFFDKTGVQAVDDFFKHNKHAIFDAVRSELSQLRLKSIIPLSTILPPKTVMALREPLP